jgi:ParB family transcriptional regulator, chromosome partitioning protein
MATKKLKGLGRGLDALLGGDASNTPAAPSGAPSQLPVAQIQAGKYQPRTRMDDGSLAELAASIKSQGIMQPVLVRPIDVSPSGARYEIIAGERRFRAAQLAGLDEIPVLVREVDDQNAAAMALIENIQREDLNPIEEAQAYRQLADDYHLTQEQIADSVGKDRSSVANYLRLLRLPTEVRNNLSAGTLSMGHARALLALTDESAQLRVARDILARNLSVRETESIVKKTAEPEQPRAEPQKDVHTKAAEDKLRFALGTRVRIIRKGKRGRIEVDFQNEDELHRLYEHLTEKR